MKFKGRAASVFCTALLLATTLVPLFGLPASAAVGVRANAGSSQVANVGDTVTVDGSRSYTLSGNALNYTWDFNLSDGIQEDANGVIASHQYNDSGVFTVTLTVDDGEQFDSDTTTIVVTTNNGTVPGVPNLPPVAVPPRNQLGRQNVSMVFDGSRSFDPNGDALYYEWDFNELDGLTVGGDAQGSVVNWTYTTAGVYNVTLIVSDGNASDSAGTSAIITPDNGTIIPGVNIPPVAVAEGDQIGRAGDTFNFNANRSFDADGDAMNFYWDFDSRDGATHTDATGEQVSHVYGNTGIYNVTLTVTDPQGQDTDILRVIVTDITGGVPGVGNLPPIVLIRSPIPGTRWAQNEPIHFNGCDSRDPEGEDLIYQWNFPDGDMSSACETNHSFVDSGIKFVQLLAQDPEGVNGFNSVTIIVNGSGPFNRQPSGDIVGPDNGRVGEPLNFTANYTDPDNDDLNYTWDFDTRDGLSPQAFGRNVTWTFDAPCMCTVSVQVSDGHHRNAPVIGTQGVNIQPKELHPPIANAGNDTTAQAGQGVVFNGSGTDSDGTITLYEWDFDGDGVFDYQDSNSAFAIYAYQRPGSYAAVLRVTDNDGLTDTDSRTVTVTPRPNNLPVADAGPDHTDETQGVQTYFQGSGTDSDGRIVLYEWDFDGDGQYDYSDANNGSARYTYPQPGTFSAVLRVTDNDGGKATDTAVIVVKRNQAPVASAGADQAVTAGTEVHFNGAGSRDAEGPITKYSWDFDSADGITQESTEVAPVHTYTTKNNYLVTLTVWDQFGQSSSDTLFVSVSQTAGLELTVDEAGKEVAPGQSTSYQLTLKNTGDGTDSFRLTVTGADPDITAWYTLDQPQVNNVEAGGIRVVRLTVSVPQGALVSAEAPVTATAASVLEQAKTSSVDVQTAVKPVYKIEATFTALPNEVVPGKPYDVTVRVVNQGNDRARINFTMGAGESQWLTVVTPTPSPVDAGKSKEFTFSLTVPAGTRTGSYSLSITARAVGTNATDSETTTVSVKGSSPFLPTVGLPVLALAVLLVFVLMVRHRPSRRT